MVFPYFCLVSSTPRTVYKNIKHTWINYPINSKTKTKSYLYFYFYKFQQFLTFSYISKLLQNASILIQLKIKILQPFFNFHTLQNTSCLHYWLNICYCKQVFIFWWYGLTIILSLQHKSLFNCFFYRLWNHFQTQTVWNTSLKFLILSYSILKIIFMIFLVNYVQTINF